MSCRAQIATGPVSHDNKKLCESILEKAYGGKIPETLKSTFMNSYSKTICTKYKQHGAFQSNNVLARLHHGGVKNNRKRRKPCSVASIAEDCCLPPQLHDDDERCWPTQPPCLEIVVEHCLAPPPGSETVLGRLHGFEILTPGFRSLAVGGRPHHLAQDMVLNSVRQLNHLA